jgi:rieske iron-sulfur protein
MESSQDRRSCECCRRNILRAGLVLGIQLGFRSALLGQDNPAAISPKEGDLLVKTSDKSATPLTPADIRVAGRQTLAWAMEPASRTVRSASRLNRILLVHLDPAKFTPETKSRAAEGVVAYSAICSHGGCDVTEWFPDQQRLLCPCHESTFDPADGAKVIDGPAPRMLPALPLGLADGSLIVLKPFTAPITFEIQ